MKKKLPLVLYFSFLIVYLELIYKCFILKNVFSLSTLTVILFSLPFVFIFSLLSTCFSKIINRVVSTIITFLLSFIFSAQVVYYAFYSSIFSIYSVKEGTGQVFGDFFSAILNMVWNNIFIIILLFLPFVLYLIFANKVFNFERSKRFSLVLSIMFVVSFFINYAVISFSDKGMYSISRLYKETHAPMITINKVGLLSMELLDLKRYIFGFEDKLYNIDNIIDDGSVIEEEVKYNKLNIDFDSLISSEEDETVKAMHEYFKSVIPTKQNEYTGIFKDKNLIYITAEGFDSIAVNETVTPTLYKLVNNGFVFENYYQPLFTVSTSDGEYMYMNSLIPKEGVWSFSRSSNIYIPFGIGRVFNNLGYSTVNAYHGHTYTYYDRQKSHPNLGFNVYKGCGNGLEKLMNCKRWPESDVEMVEATIGDYINSDKFMVYYMTISGHLNYTFVGNSISYKNKSLVESLPYSSNVKAYIAANIEFDKALEKLINSLEENGKLDDTVIVISPDHYPYGLKVDELNEISSKDRGDKFEMYHTNLIIYNSAMEKSVNVSKYVSSIDVLPTIYNLFGVEYDSRLLMGRDALSDEDGLVMLSDRSWINEKGSYNSIDDKFIPFVEGIDDSYVENINNKVYGKFTISSLLLQQQNGIYLDYYRKLGI